MVLTVPVTILPVLLLYLIEHHCKKNSQFNSYLDPIQRYQKISFIKFVKKFCLNKFVET